MAFGSSFSFKPRRAATDVRPVTGALVRIVVLAILAAIGAGWGIWAYYTHVFRPHPAPRASEIEVELK